MPADHQRPRPEALVELARQRRDQHHHQRHRQRAQAGFERRVALHVLEVQGDEVDRRRTARSRPAPTDQIGDAERPAAEERRAAPSAPAARPSQTTNATSSTTAPPRKPSVCGDVQLWLFVPIRPDDRGTARGDEHRADDVERRRSRVPRLGHRPERHRGGHDPDRHVDPEDRRPADVLDEEAAEQRADRQAEAGDAGPDADRRGSCWRGKAATMIESESGFIIAAPTPCSARAAISCRCRWSESAHAADATVKIARPTRNSRLRPKRSPSLPPSRISAANERT